MLDMKFAREILVALAASAIWAVISFGVGSWPRAVETFGLVAVIGRMVASLTFLLGAVLMFGLGLPELRDDRKSAKELYHGDFFRTTTYDWALYLILGSAAGAVALWILWHTFL